MTTQRHALSEPGPLPLLGHQIAGVMLGVSLVMGLFSGPYLIIQMMAYGVEPASWKGIQLIAWFLWNVATAIASIRAMRRSRLPSKATVGLIIALLWVTVLAGWID